jgi:hypothetical protein
MQGVEAREQLKGVGSNHADVERRTLGVEQAAEVVGNVFEYKHELAGFDAHFLKTDDVWVGD